MDNPTSEEKLVFHYSREARLAKATPAVRNLNEPRSGKRPSLFRTLTATRGSAFLLLAILMLSATVVMTTLFSLGGNEGNLLHNHLSVDAFRYENSVYIALKKTKRSSSAWEGKVQVAIQSEGILPVETREIFFTLSNEEEFRFSSASPLSKLTLLLSAGGETLSLTATVK